MKNLKRRIALLLTFVLAFSNVMPAVAAETVSPAAELQTPASEETQTPASEETQTPASEETGEQKDVENPKQEAEAPAESKQDESTPAAGEEEPVEAAVSGDAAADNNENEETVSEGSVSEGSVSEGSVSGTDIGEVSQKDDTEKAAGSAPVGTLIDEEEIPEGWAVSPEDSAVWYKEAENKYNVYFSDSAYIGFYPENNLAATDAEITIYKAEGADGDTTVIVDGGECAEGTSISVDSSLSDNTLVAHGSIVETDTNFIRVQGLNKKPEMIPGIMRKAMRIP